MKQKEKDTIRNSSVEELKKKLLELSHDLVRIAKERYTRQSKNIREGKMIRQKIARIQTIIREKELSV